MRGLKSNYLFLSCLNFKVTSSEREEGREREGGKRTSSVSVKNVRGMLIVQKCLLRTIKSVQRRYVFEDPEADQYEEVEVCLLIGAVWEEREK